MKKHLYSIIMLVGLRNLHFFLGMRMMTEIPRLMKILSDIENASNRIVSCR